MLLVGAAVALPALEPAAPPPELPSPRFLIHYQPGTAFVVVPAAQNAPIVDINSVSLRVYDPSNNWLRIEASPGQAGTHTPRDANQVFTSVFDSSANALHVTCISGCGGVFGTDIAAIDSSHQKVVGFYGIPLSPAAPSNGQVYQFNAAQNQWTPGNVSGLFGTGNNNDFMGWNGSTWAPMTVTFTNLTGAASPSQLPAATASAAGAVQLAADVGGQAATPWVVSTHLTSPLPVAQGGTGVSAAGQSGQCLTSSGSLTAWSYCLPNPINTTIHVDVKAFTSVAQAEAGLTPGSAATIYDDICGDTFSSDPFNTSTPVYLRLILARCSQPYVLNTPMKIGTLQQLIGSGRGISGTSVAGTLLQMGPAFPAAVAAVPPAPQLSATTSGCTAFPAAGTYYGKVTYANAAGETPPSAESSGLALNGTSQCLLVNSPSPASGATGYRVYVAGISGAETYQGTSNLGQTLTISTINTTGNVPSTLNSTGALITLGSAIPGSGSAAYQARVENLSIDCQGGAQSIGVLNALAQEDSGAFGVDARNCTGAAAFVAEGYNGGTGANNSSLEHLTVADATVATCGAGSSPCNPTYCVLVDGVNGLRQVQSLSCTPNSGVTVAGVEVKGTAPASGPGSQGTAVRDIHCEGQAGTFNSCVEGIGAQLAVEHLTTSAGTLYAVHLDAASFDSTVSDILPYTGTHYALLDSINSYTSPAGQRIGFYAVGSAAGQFVSNDASLSAGTFYAAPPTASGPATYRAIVAADIPTLNQSTTGTAGGLSGTPSIAVNSLSATTINGAALSGTFTGSPTFGGTPVFSNTLAVNTSGNAGTATALAATPTVCNSGQAAQGISANGNATGCFTPGGGAPGGSSGAVQGNVSSAFGAIPGFTFNTTSGALTSTSMLTASGFNGPLTGNVTGNVTGTATGLSGTPSVTVNALSATTINGAALSGTFTGSPTFSGTPVFSNTLAANTSGNAGTATALAATPTLCSAGQAAQGILASGNATGCFTPSGMTYPSAGVAFSTGSGWATSIAPSGTGAVVMASSASLSGPTIAGGALSGTFTGTPTFSGNLTFSGTPVFSNTLAANTSGNAGTATALAATPTLCSAGQAAQGILASGNATGCFTPSGGTPGGSSGAVQGNLSSAFGAIPGFTFNTTSGALTSTQTITAAGFSGPVTGNVTGNVTGTATGLSGTPSVTVNALSATTINGSALSGTFTGSPTFSGTPVFSNTLSLNTTGTSGGLSGTPSIAVNGLTATTINGAALSGTFSGNPTFSGTPVFSNTLAANTSGNAGTATALAGTPTTCTAGQAALGITANGNAAGCWTPTGSGTVGSGSANQVAEYSATGTSVAGIWSVLNTATKRNGGVHVIVGTGVSQYATTSLLLAGANYAAGTVLDVDDYNCYNDTTGTPSFNVDPATYKLVLSVHFHCGGTIGFVGWHLNKSNEVVESVGPSTTFFFDSTKPVWIPAPSSAPTVVATSTGCTSPSITAGKYIAFYAYTDANDYDLTTLSPGTSAITVASGQCLAWTIPANPGNGAQHFIRYVATANGTTGVQNGKAYCQDCSNGAFTTQSFGSGTSYMNSLNVLIADVASPGLDFTEAGFVLGNESGGIVTGDRVNNITVDAQGTPGAVGLAQISAQENSGFTLDNVINVDGQTHPGFGWALEGMDATVGANSGESHTIFVKVSTCSTSPYCTPAGGTVGSVTTSVFPNACGIDDGVNHYSQLAGEYDCAPLDAPAAGGTAVTMSPYVFEPAPYNIGPVNRLTRLENAHVESSSGTGGFQGTVTPYNGDPVEALIDNEGAPLLVVGANDTSTLVPYLVYSAAGSNGSSYLSITPADTGGTDIAIDDAVSGYTSAAGQAMANYSIAANGNVMYGQNLDLHNGGTVRIPNVVDSTSPLTLAGQFSYDTANGNYRGFNGTDELFPLLSGTATNGDCAKFSVVSGKVTLADQGAACGGGSGTMTENGYGSGTPLAAFSSSTVLTPATSSNVVALFSSCSGTQYLGADGNCHTPSAATMTSSGYSSGTPLAAFSTATNVTPATSSNVVALFSGCSGTQYLGADGNCHTATANPAGTAGQYQINNTAFAGSTALTNSAANGAGSVVVTQIAASAAGAIFLPVASATADLAEWIAPGQAAPSNGICAGSSLCSEWIDASGNWNFQGNNGTWGATGQTTAANLNLIGGSTSTAGPYIHGTDSTGAVANTYFTFDPTASGVACLLTSIGTGACPATSTVATLGATQTLTNKTLTTPTINGAALSGTLSGSPTFGGTPVFSNTLALNTSGNAGTATALASTPSLCSTGQAPTGITANGNATGCAPFGTGTMTSSGYSSGTPLAAFSTATNVTPATSSNVVALFSSCSGTEYLGADGNCHTASSGTVTSSGYTSGTPLAALSTATNVTPATFSNVVGLFSGCSGTMYLGFDGNCHSASGSGTVTSSGYTTGTPMAAFSTATNITPATYSNVVALFSSCSGTQYLGADGNCHTASSGTVTSSGYTSGTPLAALSASTNITPATYSNVVALFSSCSGTQYLGADGNCHNGSGVGALFVANPDNNLGAGPVTDGVALNGATLRGTESSSRTPIPVACTAHNLYVTTAGTQPSTGSLVISLGVAGTAQALSVTYAASASGGTSSDTTDTVSLSAGNQVDYIVTNNASTSSLAIVSVSMECN